MIRKNHVEGLDRGDILIYALSTCGWCRKTKNYLREQGVAFDYIDVDLLSDDDSDEVMKEIGKYNKGRSFPTIVINNTHGIIGYNAEKLKEFI